MTSNVNSVLAACVICPNCYYSPKLFLCQKIKIYGHMQPPVKYQAKKETQVTKNNFFLILKNLDNKQNFMIFPWNCPFFWNSMIFSCMEFFYAKFQVFQVSWNTVKQAIYTLIYKLVNVPCCAWECNSRRRELVFFYFEAGRSNDGASMHRPGQVPGQLPDSSLIKQPQYVQAINKFRCN